MGAYGSPYLDPITHVGPLDGITKRASAAGITVSYVQGTNLDGGDGVGVPASAFMSAGAPGLHAEYFANENLEGTPALTRTRRDDRE